MIVSIGFREYKHSTQIRNGNLIFYVYSSDEDLEDTSILDYGDSAIPSALHVGLIAAG